MKTYLYLAFIFLTLINCSKNNEEIQSNNKLLIGKWELNEVYGSDGGSPIIWRPASVKYTYQFYNDGTFISTKFNDCTKGNYTISSSNEVMLKYSCATYPTSLAEKIESITNSELILNPTYLSCDEGCKEKFIRILD